jgi:hypothetical protein
MPAFAHDLAGADDDGANHRIRMRRPATSLAELERALEEVQATASASRR